MATMAANPTRQRPAGNFVLAQDGPLPEAGPAAEPQTLPPAREFSGRLDEENEQRWQQVLRRDPAAAFVYAVETTGICCRPSCSSRRPNRANVRFFSGVAEACRAGFRPCLRCRPQAQPAEAELIEQLTRAIERDLERKLSLRELGRLAGLTPGSVQRLFVRVLGLSPRAWANARRAETYRALLSQPDGGRLTDAVYSAGFSSPSRAHQAAPLGMKAGRFRAKGAGERIGYAVAAASALGRVLVAATSRGVCAVLLGDDEGRLASDLAARFPQAVLAPDAALAPQLAAVLNTLDEHPSTLTLPLDLRGTAFQARVWAALRTIPRGETRSYAQLAAEIGVPKAVRAVAAACGQNPAAIVIPCHRVVGSNGKLTGYRWGLERKRALLAREAGGKL